MENGKWKMENGKWKMENEMMQQGRMKMENEKWKMENGKWKMENEMMQQGRMKKDGIEKKGRKQGNSYKPRNSTFFFTLRLPI